MLVHQFINNLVIRVVKLVIIVTTVYVNLSTFFVFSHVLSAKVSSEWSVNLGFRSQKCPFSPEAFLP